MATIHESVVHDGLALLARKGPWLVSCLLTAFIVLELTRTAFSLWGDHPAPVAPLTAAATSPKRAADVSTIVDAHLFGTALPEASAQATARATAANLVLNGTISTQDPRRGFAIIKDDGPEKVYSIDEEIGGAALYSVYSDHVVLNRNGVLETLLLQRLRQGASQSLPVYQAAAAPVLPLYTDSLGRTVDKPPSKLDKLVHFIDSVDAKTGKLRGFLVYPVKSGAPLRAMGLDPGDLVTRINGLPLNDLKSGKAAIESMQSSGAGSVTIERQGRSMDLTLSVSDALMAADNEPLAAGNPPAATVEDP